MCHRLRARRQDVAPQTVSSPAMFSGSIGACGGWEAPLPSRGLGWLQPFSEAVRGSLPGLAEHPLNVSYSAAGIV